MIYITMVMDLWRLCTPFDEATVKHAVHHDARCLFEPRRRDGAGAGVWRRQDELQNDCAAAAGQRVPVNVLSGHRARSRQPPRQLGFRGKPGHKGANPYREVHYRHPNVIVGFAVDEG
jgi:hypothetical protein